MNDKRLNDNRILYYADKRFLPFARLLFKTRRPPIVFMRSRKPWVRFLQRVFGW